MKRTMQIVELKEVTAQQMADLTGLMKELSERVTMTEEALLNVLKDDNSHLFALMAEGVVVGCATLCVFHSDGTKGICGGCCGEQHLPGSALGSRIDGTHVGGGSKAGSYRSATDVETRTCGSECTLSVIGLSTEGNQLLPFGVELNEERMAGQRRMAVSGVFPGPKRRS